MAQEPISRQKEFTFLNPAKGKYREGNDEEQRLVEQKKKCAIEENPQE